MILTTWKPSLRRCVFQERPDDIPDEVYKQAVAAKRQYNENWEFWVYLVSQDFNVSQGEAEEACIRGIKREILKLYVIYGDRIGKWFEEYLEMGDIFNKIRYPIYVPRLTDPLLDSKNRIDQ